jgi:nucleotide-binding universal stress UspA family protein
MTAPVAPILICYDGSQGARSAIATAADLFAGRPAIVLHVWSPVAVIAAAYAGAVAIPAYTDDEILRASTAIAEDGRALAAAAGLEARAEVAKITLDGIWPTILAVADRDDARVIVLGARGLSTFKALVLGSVSHGVAQHSHRPVLVVPPPGDAAATA